MFSTQRRAMWILFCSNIVAVDMCRCHKGDNQLSRSIANDINISSTVTELHVTVFYYGA